MHFCKIMFCTLTLTSLLSLNTITYAETFKDIKPSDWFFNSINQLAEQKLITGYPDNTFKPMNAISRVEYLALLLNVLKKPTQTTHSTSIAATLKNARSIALVDALDMTENMVNSIEKPITRKEAAVFASRLMSMRGENLSETFYDFNRVNEDLAALPLYYKKPILQVIASGVMIGTLNKRFSSELPLSRAEAALIVNCILKPKLRKIPLSTKVKMPSYNTTTDTKQILTVPDAYIIPSSGMNVNTIKLLSPPQLPLKISFNEKYQRFTLNAGSDQGRLILFANGESLGEVPAATDTKEIRTGEYLLENTPYYYADFLGFISSNSNTMKMIPNPFYHKNVDRTFYIGDTGISLISPNNTYLVSDVINHAFSGPYITPKSHPAILKYDLKNYTSIEVLDKDPYGIYFKHTGTYVDLFFPNVSFDDLFYIKGSTPIGHCSGIPSKNGTTVSINRGNPFDDEDQLYNHAEYLAISIVKDGEKQLLAFPNPFAN